MVQLRMSNCSICSVGAANDVGVRQRPEVNVDQGTGVSTGKEFAEANMSLMLGRVPAILRT